MITTLACSLSSAVVPSVVDVTVVTPDESQVTLKVCSPLQFALCLGLLTHSFQREHIKDTRQQGGRKPERKGGYDAW
jgi:hypothetical protein